MHYFNGACKTFCRVYNPKNQCLCWQLILFLFSLIAIICTDARILGCVAIMVHVHNQCLDFLHLFLMCPYKMNAMHYSNSAVSKSVTSVSIVIKRSRGFKSNWMDSTCANQPHLIRSFDMRCLRLHKPTKTKKWYQYHFDTCWKQKKYDTVYSAKYSGGDG